MAVCAGGVGLALLRWSANDVRDDSGELISCFVFSLTWIVLTQMLFEFLGVGLRDDAVEPKNRGALFTMAGLTIGVSCCVAGSNVGNVPGPEVVFFCMAFPRNGTAPVDATCESREPSGGHHRRARYRCGFACRRISCRLR